MTYEVTAILDKDCPAGNWVSDINLKTSNPAVAKLRIPVTVNVTAPRSPRAPESVSFGNVALGIHAREEDHVSRAARRSRFWR